MLCVATLAYLWTLLFCQFNSIFIILIRRWWMSNQRDDDDDGLTSVCVFFLSYLYFWFFVKCFKCDASFNFSYFRFTWGQNCFDLINEAKLSDSRIVANYEFSSSMMFRKTISSSLFLFVFLQKSIHGNYADFGVIEPVAGLFL